MTRPGPVIACLLVSAFALYGQAAAASPGPSQTDLLLSGSSEALWLLRGTPEEGTYDIVVRPVDGKWRWVTEGVRGKPVAATATGKSLHLILTSPKSYLVYDAGGQPPTGRNPLDPRWPDDAEGLAICPAGGLAEGLGAGSAVLAVVARPYQPTTSPTKATVEAGPTASFGPAVTVMTLGVFRKAGIDWEHLVDCPTPVALAADSRIFAAVTGEDLYVLVDRGSHGKSTLLGLRGKDWQDISLADWPAGSRAIRVESIGNRPVFVLSVSVDRASADPVNQYGVVLATYDPESESFQLQPVVQADQAAWHSVSVPQSTTFARQLAFLWRDGAAIKFARCGLNGELSATEEIDIFAKGAEDHRGRDIIQIFMWALLIAFVGLFITRPPGAAMQFVLPQTVRPGSPLKRIPAALMDMMPWSAISFLIFHPEWLSDSPAELLEYVKSIEYIDPMPANLAYFMISSSLLYVAYGTVMEYRYGATIGKMIFKLRVVGQNGARPSLRAALLRNLVRTVEMSWPLLPLPLFLMIITRNKQRLGDMVARTAVIDTTFVPPPGLAPPSPGPDTDHAGRDALGPDQPVDDTTDQS